jgi:predicted RNA-binding protein with PUA-like domain
VASHAYPDATQFEARGKYFDSAATAENPRWMNVDVQLVRKTRLVSLAELREHKALEGMILLKRGNRLSITPVTPAEWKYITGKLIGKQ